jgi:hypothetical protein
VPAPGIGRGECKGSWLITPPPAVVRDGVVADVDVCECEAAAEELLVLLYDALPGDVCLFGCEDAERGDVWGPRKAEIREKRENGRCEDGIFGCESFSV